MAELTSSVMDIVESSKWDDDTKQDFYVRWLELEDMPEFVELSHLRGYCQQVYNNLHRNELRKKRNRQRIEQESKDEIIRELGLDGQSADPRDLLMAQEEYEDILKHMSPLIRAAYTGVVLNGEDVGSVAEAGRTTPNVIYQRVWEAKKQIKEGLL